MQKLKPRHKERGAVVAEFAIVLPLLFTILAGITEFGLLFYNQQVLTNATREGARAGSAYWATPQIQQIVSDYCANRLISFSTPPSVASTVTGGGAYPNNIRVSASYNYNFLVPGLFGLGASMTLNASTLMRMESISSGP